MLLEKTVFKMYVKAGCSYCDSAKEIILNGLKCSLELIDITSQPDLQEMIISNTGQRTVPAIYIGEEFLGGCDTLVAAVRTGEIKMKILIEENRLLKEEIIRLKGVDNVKE